MNNSVIDVAFIAAKVAAIKNEKARMIVGGVSLVYNVAQIARSRSMIIELSQNKALPLHQSRNSTLRDTAEWCRN